MGRKRTPTALKLLRGNPGKRKLFAEPTPGVLEPAIPNELRDDVARAEWVATIVPAIRAGQVTNADRVLALAHCELFATWRSQLDAAGARHMVTTGRRGRRVPNPLRVLAQTTLRLLSHVDEKLGFSPTSRSKVSIVGPAAVASGLDRGRAAFLKPTGRG